MGLKNYFQIVQNPYFPTKLDPFTFCHVLLKIVYHTKVNKMSLKSIITNITLINIYIYIYMKTKVSHSVSKLHYLYAIPNDVLLIYIFLILWSIY